MFHKLCMIGNDFSAQMKKQNISAYAASIAFFFFLSIVPMLMVICTVIPYTPLTEENLVQAITDITPDIADPLAESLVADVYDQSAGILSIAAIATLWSAAKGVMALMQGLNAVNGVTEKRNYFVVRGVACFYTFVMLIVVILSLFLNVFGNRFVDIALYRIPQLKHLVSLAMHFRFLVVWAVLTLLFAMIYAFLPDDKLRFREQIPGATFSAVVWNLFLGLFPLCQQQRFLRHLRESCDHYHHTALDVFLYVYHHDRGLSQPVFPAGEQNPCRNGKREWKREP